MFLVLFAGCWADGPDDAPSEPSETPEVSGPGDAYARALEAWETGDPDAALPLILEALAGDSTNPSYLMLGADILMDQGNALQAIQLMQNGVAAHPENPDFTLRIAEIHLYVERPEEAIGFANDALRIDPYEPYGYFLKGYAYKMMGDTVKALSNFQTSVEQDPTFYDGHLQLGLLLSRQRDDLALLSFENALRIDPRSREAHYGIGYHHQFKGDFQAAIRAYRDMLQIHPSDEEAFYNIGYCYLQLDSLGKAHTHFGLAIQVEPDYAEAYFMQGYVSELAGDIPAARSSYETALRLAPGNEVVTEALERINSQTP